MISELKLTEGGRAGTQALSLLAIPINASVMQALIEEPKPLLDLRREAGSPPQTTLRGHLRTLTHTGLVEKHRRNEFPGNVEYELGESGRELLGVTEALRAWLSAYPEGPTVLGGSAAKSAIKALVEGWSTSIVRVLASQPRSLTELDAIITSTSYPSLERRLGAMRLATLVEPLSSQGRGTPYGVSEWLRRAIGPLTAAARWESQRPFSKVPVSNEDVEAAFLLTLPLLSLAPSLTGSCRLVVRVEDGEKESLAGVIASVREGRVESYEAGLEESTDAWVLGTTDAWFTALIERDLSVLEMGGRKTLATELIDGLHGALFSAEPSGLDPPRVT